MEHRHSPRLPLFSLFSKHLHFFLLYNVDKMSIVHNILGMNSIRTSNMRQVSRSRKILNIKEVKLLKTFKSFSKLYVLLSIVQITWYLYFFICKNIWHLFSFQKNISSMQNHYYILPLYVFIIYIYIYKPYFKICI